MKLSAMYSNRKGKQRIHLGMGLQFQLQIQVSLFRGQARGWGEIGIGSVTGSIDCCGLLLPHPVMVQVNSSIKPISKTIVFRSMADRGNFNENSFCNNLILFFICCYSSYL